LKLKNLLFIVFLLPIGNLYAQSDFRQGYVIKKQGDTLFGKIDYRGDLIMSKTCRFKPLNSDSILTFAPIDIKEFRFENSKCYVSRTLDDGNNVFLEFLIKGKLNVYYYLDKESYYYLIDKEGYPLKVLPFREGIKFREDGTRVLFQSKNHIGLLNYYTHDAPDFQSSIESIKEPGRENLIRLAEKYQKKVCKNEPCIIYDKKLSSLKLSFEPLIGFAKYNNSYFEFRNVNEFGVNLFLWMPRSNEKIYFKTGLICGKGDRVNINKIPLQIQYLYPKGRLRPNVSIGTDFYIENFSGIKSSYNMLHLSGGLIYKIYKSIYFSTNLNSEYTSIMSFAIQKSEKKFDILSYSLNFGLYIEL
jgi:hypothetical protein